MPVKGGGKVSSDREDTGLPPVRPFKGKRRPFKDGLCVGKEASDIPVETHCRLDVLVSEQ